MRKLLVSVVTLALLCGAAAADVQLPRIFGNNMVLQQGMPWNIWGLAAPGEKVTVTVGENTASAVASADGKWKIALPALKAGGPIEIVVAGNNTIAIKNVLVGEVWVASGQSNMYLTVSGALNAKAEIAQSGDPQLRVFTVPKTAADVPEFSGYGSWEAASPATTGKFTAVGYFFGRELRRELNVPVGIIHASSGGKKIELFLLYSVVGTDPKFKPMCDEWKQFEATFKAQDAANADAIRKAGGTPEEIAKKLKAAHRRWLGIGSVYNGMVAPFVGYPIQGVIWYQGEANVNNAYQYRTLQPELIRQWRQAWGQGDFPFLFVQLANYAKDQKMVEENFWSELREAQLKSLSVPNTAMAVTIDVGDRTNIHPKDKQTVSRRLALAAMATAYGRKIVYSGPIYDSMKVEGGKVRVAFKHVGGGLVAKGGELKTFAVAGEDQKFVPATAVIEGDTVVVSSPAVAKPVAVSYGWESDPACNLYNKEGLPASPFRTDDWKRKTQPE